MVSTLTGLDLTKQENILLFEYTETTESKPDKLETSITMIHSCYGDAQSSLNFWHHQLWQIKFCSIGPWKMPPSLLGAE